jgi:sugar (pentulose or hexulose) kinase
MTAPVYLGPIYLGIDLGTQSVRVMAVAEDGAVLASAAEPLQSTREEARHEQEPEHWWRAVVFCCRLVMGELGSGAEIKGLAVDATSGTILLMDDGLRALTPGLMYDDGRARDEAVRVNEAGGALWSELSYRMQPSWALPKLLWLARHTAIAPGAHLAHQNDFIHARLAGRLLPTDSSNSLKTGYDFIRQQWPAAILDELGLDLTLFPEVVLPGKPIGKVCAAAASETGLPAGTPVFAGMTDGCAAQIASGATTPGSWNSVIGTTLVIKGVTRELLHDPLGVVYSHRSADGLWLPGGASSTGAGAIAKEFSPADLLALNNAALEMEPTQLVVYPLAGEGERYPFSAPGAHGFTFSKMSEAASEQERYRAVLQGIALIERLAFDALRHIGASTGGSFTVSGGATKSEALNQIRADVLERELSMPRVTECAFGMAMLAAAHASSIAEVTDRMIHIERTVSPKRAFGAYAEQYATLIHELARREWLPQPLADAALRGADAALRGAGA